VHEFEVLVVGGGPSGMMLGAELRLAGVDVAILERRTTPGLVGSRGGGFHSRTIETLDQRGIANRFLAEGRTAQAAMLGSTVLDISDFPTRHPYSLALWQNHIERILATWIGELGVPVHRGRELIGLTQDNAGVDVQMVDGAPMRARYLVGADGGRSDVRRATGIAFTGPGPTRSNLIAEVEVTEEPPKGPRQDETGVHGLQRMEDGHTFRVIVAERELGPATEPTIEDLSAALTVVFGTDFGVRNPTWISRFTDATRQAASYRAGRVLLTGDAAHIHYPSGGQGIGLGMQDSVNLGWKLAQVVRGAAPDSLLETYDAERRPVGARALDHTMAQSLLQRGDARSVALKATVNELLSVGAARDLIAATVHGLDIHYELGDGHPLLGRRMPDLDLDTADGPLRTYSLLHAGRPALVNFGPPGAFDVGPWADRVPLVNASYDGVWELPGLGAVDAPDAVLIRPDGYVAWTAGPADLALADALNRWFGPPG
jgi:3-(3-hydroxy-phenyl)propionate hydroxylase